MTDTIYTPNPLVAHVEARLAACSARYDALCVEIDVFRAKHDTLCAEIDALYAEIALLFQNVI